MNIRKLIPVLSLFAFGFLSQASATLWSGTITETLTATTNPNYKAGDSYVGTYQYESDTIDGDFGSKEYSQFYGGGIQFGTLDFTLQNFLDGYLLHNNDGGSARNHMVIENGEVKSFTFVGELGLLEYAFQLSAGFNDLNVFGYRNEGTLIFSNPVAIPDSSNTLALFLPIVLLIAAIKTRRQGTKTMPVT